MKPRLRPAVETCVTPVSDEPLPEKTTMGVANKRRFVSVGTRLAGASMALVVLVTAVLYVAVSRYERENLLHAKELSANAVTRLFSATAASAVVFEDDAAVAEQLATLGSGEDIGYAAVWAVRDGVVGTRLGERSQGGLAVQRATAVEGLVVERHDHHLVVWAPVRDPQRVVIGMAAVVFSLAGENAAIARVERRLLLVSAGIAVGLVALLTWVSRRAIVKPLDVLVGLTKKLEQGEHVQIELRSNDEIGQLATAFGNMAVAIHSREERINARNADLRLVLDNVEQGFITLDLEGKMAEEWSRVVTTWFGPVAAATPFWSFLATVDAAVADDFELNWEAIGEDFLPLDLCLDQLPRCVRDGDRTFELAYRPVMDGEALAKVIVVITDVTARLARELAEQGQREMLGIFHRLLTDRPAFEGFFAEADALVTSIVGFDGSDDARLRREIHTLKGNASLFGIESLARFCHGCEDRLASGESFGDSCRVTLRGHWTRVSQLRAGIAGGGHVTMGREEFDALLVTLRERKASADVIDVVASLAFESAGRRLALLGEQTVQLAERLGKAPVVIALQPTSLRLPPEKWSLLWSAFAHVVRNVVDHGVEEPEERVATGKPPHATISYAIEHASPFVLLTVRDDGRGIDWPAVAAKASALGLPCATSEDLHAALFADGLSTREQASATSGRGVGLGAMRAVLGELGGGIEVHSVRGEGTTFRLVLPDAMLRADADAAPAPVRVAA